MECSCAYPIALRLVDREETEGVGQEEEDTTNGRLTACSSAATKSLPVSSAAVVPELAPLSPDPLTKPFPLADDESVAESVELRRTRRK